MNKLLTEGDDFVNKSPGGKECMALNNCEGQAANFCLPSLLKGNGCCR